MKQVWRYWQLYTVMYYLIAKRFQLGELTFSDEIYRISSISGWKIFEYHGCVLDSCWIPAVAFKIHSFSFKIVNVHRYLVSVWFWLFVHNNEINWFFYVVIRKSCFQITDEIPWSRCLWRRRNAMYLTWNAWRVTMTDDYGKSCAKGYEKIHKR